MAEINLDQSLADIRELKARRLADADIQNRLAELDLLRIEVIELRKDKARLDWILSISPPFTTRDDIDKNMKFISEN